MSQRNEPLRARPRNQADTGTDFTGERSRYAANGYNAYRNMKVPDTDDFSEVGDYPLQRFSSTTRQDTLRTTSTRRSAPAARTTGVQGRSPVTRDTPLARDYASPQRRTRDDLPSAPLPKKPQQSKKMHWLLPVGLTVVALILLWVISSSVLAWGTQVYNNIRYGYPRTFQTDAVVGHDDSKAHPSHFIAINLNHQVVIEEFMGGDPTKVVTYVAPVYITGAGGDLAPVTLQFRDVNGDGKPDMIIYIHLPNQVQVSVFINTGSKFRPATSNDKIQLNP